MNTSVSSESIQQAIQSGNKVCIEIALNEMDLLRLASHHHARPYMTSLYTLLATHSQASEQLHLHLLDLSDFDSGIANTIATSGKASEKVLNKLLESSSWSVVGHARLALLIHKLNRLEESDFASVLAEYSGEDEYSLAARHLVASHLKTPVAILEQLTKDDYKHISQTALYNLIHKEA